ncbi:MAG: AglZ/HisF2 family acetamidino modification protein [Chitinophagaceae bacterium]
MIPRIIPVLLLSNKGLVKTHKFKNPIYVGDPINAVKIFNDKEVDEIILLDIEASKQNKEPDYKYIEEIASESFMPFAYGGGIKNIEQVQQLFRLGAEKVIFNTSLILNNHLLREAADFCGNQSVVASIDVKKSLLGGYEVYSHIKKKITGIKPAELAKQAVASGAGEIMITSVDNDGIMQGYDLKLIEFITSFVNIPVIACGGAGNLKHLREGIQQGNASAAAAGSMFVFHGKHKAVLINYPTRKDIIEIFN